MAADLEDAAGKALDAVRALHERVAEAHRTLESVQQRIERVAPELKEDWTELAEAAQELITRAQEDLSRLEDFGEEASQAAGVLGQELGVYKERLVRDARASTDDSTRLREAVAQSAPPLRTLVDGLGERTRAFSERAAELKEQLAQAVAETREFLQETAVQALSDMQEQVRTRAQEIVQGVIAESEQAIQDKYAEFEAELAQAEGILQTAYGDATSHVEAVVEFSISECREAHDQALADLTAMTAVLHDTMRRLEQAITDRRVALEQAATEMDGGLGGTQDGLDFMEAALNGVKELMASFAFLGG